MKRLLQINATANWGSTGKIAEGIGLRAIKRDWDSWIAYGRNCNSSHSNLIKVGAKLDVYLHYARHRLLDNEGLGSIQATKKFIDRIQDLSPDVIHLHNLHDHWLNYPLLFEYLAKIKTPIVWTFHDCWAFTGGCGYFIPWNCENWKKDCGSCPISTKLCNKSQRNLELKKKAIDSIKDRLYIVSVSNWLDSLIPQSILNNVNRTIIHNGVDINVFQPIVVSSLDNKYDFREKEIVLGVSNIWASHKGLRDFIELRKWLDSRYIIVLVGLSKKQISQLPAGIIGIPRLNNVKELAALYSRAQVVLSLSYAETFGMTLVESLACGTPVVGYDTTAVREVISSKIGYKVELGNIGIVADRVKEICSASQLISPEICRNYVIDNFNQITQFDKYVDLYESLISRES